MTQKYAQKADDEYAFEEKEVGTYNLLDASCCRVILVADSVFAIVGFLPMNISYCSRQRR